MAIKKSKVEDQTVDNEVSKTSEAKSESMMVPLADVEKLIQEAVAKQMATSSSVGQGENSSELTQAIKSLNKSLKDKDNYEGYDVLKSIHPDMIDKEDRLDKPRGFWAPTFSYVIGGDKQRGQQFSGPFGVIKFMPEGSKRNQTGKEQNIFIWSKYICYSKKELEFLLGHSKFGIKFFDNMASTTNIDVREATMVANFHTALQRSHFTDLQKQAIALNIPVVDNIQHMRIAIAQSLAKKKMKEHREATNIVLKEGLKSAMLVGQSIG